VEIGDIFWAIIWFVVGLYTFENSSLKSFFEGIGVITSIVSLGFVAMKPELIPDFIKGIPVSYFVGALTHYIYLIGANINRAQHFGEDINYGRLILYGVVVVLLILILNTIKPL
jgi:hypothetical protein